MHIIVASESYLVYGNTTGYLKNHWIKHWLICIQFVAFSIMIPNMGKKFKILIFLTSVWKSYSIVSRWKVIFVLLQSIHKVRFKWNLSTFSKVTHKIILTEISHIYAKVILSFKFHYGASFHINNIYFLFTIKEEQLYSHFHSRLYAEWMSQVLKQLIKFVMKLSLVT